MTETLKKIRETYGSVEQCVLDLGLLSDEDIKQLRRNLVVDAAEDELVDWQEHEKLVATADKEADAEAEKLVAEAQAQI
jgi:hypothetical protein